MMWTMFDISAEEKSLIDGHLWDCIFVCDEKTRWIGKYTLQGLQNKKKNTMLG